jgi:hypothetical protein
MRIAKGTDLLAGLRCDHCRAGSTILADAERTLASKTTKAAAESKRIATNKIEQVLTRLDRLKAETPHQAEVRVL